MICGALVYLNWSESEPSGYCPAVSALTAETAETVGTEGTVETAEISETEWKMKLKLN